MKPLVFALLVLLAVGLSIVISAEWRAAQHDADEEQRMEAAAGAAGAPKSGQPKADPPAALAALQAEQLQAWLQTALARPLFEPGRRPVHGVSAPKITTAPRLPRLAGVLITPDHRQVIFAGGDGKPIIVGEGANVEGFVVQTISAGQVTVVGPNGVQVLHPSFDPDRRAPPTPLAIAPGIPGLPRAALPGAVIPGAGINEPPGSQSGLPRGQMAAPLNDQP